ncbi:MAG: trimethylamine methyltransferase family protein [Candidatus Latescibacter sp.]|nr:trimethylamine methyltransferase family protein [Candidatus Latescibacter sp.]
MAVELRREPFNPLTMQECQLIYQNALAVLSTVGIRVPGEDARKIYRRLGCSYNEEFQTVTIEEKIVEQALRNSRKQFLLAGRDEKHDIRIGEGIMYFSSGGGSPNYLDHGKKEVRKVTLRDVANMAHLIDYLPYIDICHRSIEPSDVSVDSIDVNKFFAWINNTTKHVILSTTDMRGFKKIRRVAEIIAGSEASLRERPIFSIVACWMISPLTLHPETTSVIIEAVRNMVPVEFSSCPMAMSTSPSTLAGTLTLFLAEILSGKVLAYGVNPDAPVLIGGAPAISDPSTLGFCAGSPEYGLLNAATAQIGRMLDCPMVVSAGYSEDKLQGAQAGYETALSWLTVALTGVDILHGLDLFDSGLAVSAESTVIGNEMAGMVKRIVEGIRVDEETIGLDVIRRVGPGGEFVTDDHTLRHFRSEFFFPVVGDRRNRTTWLNSGGLDTNERAWNTARKIWAEHEPRRLDHKIVKRIRTEFPELVA